MRSELGRQACGEVSAPSLLTGRAGVGWHTPLLQVPPVNGGNRAKPAPHALFSPHLRPLSHRERGGDPSHSLRVTNGVVIPTPSVILSEAKNLSPHPLPLSHRGCVFGLDTSTLSPPHRRTLT